MKDHLQATDMPEAIRENRVRLEDGDSPAASDILGDWHQLYRESGARLSGRLSSEWPDVPFDHLDDSERDPDHLVSYIGQQTGLEEHEIDRRLSKLFTDRRVDPGPPD